MGRRWTPATILLALLLAACSQLADDAGDAPSTQSGFTITLDTSALTAINIAVLDADNNDSGVAGFPNSGSEVVMLPTGNYRLCAPIPFSNPIDYCQDFSVDGTGLIDFATALDAIFAGRGTDTLIASGHTITLDMSALSATTRALLNGFDQLVGTFGAVNVANPGLFPGDYRFCAPSPFSFGTDHCLDFNVDDSGTVTYDASLEGVFTGAGTSALTVYGFDITLDTTGVAATTFNVETSDGVGVTTALPNTGNRTLGLLADAYRFCAPVGQNCLDFSVTDTGLVAYDPALEGIFTGAGTGTLTVSDNTAPTVDGIMVPLDPTDIAQAVSVSATFSDPPGEGDTPYSCTIDFDDGNGPQAGTVNGSDCSGSNLYAEPGVYTVSVTVTDMFGASGSAVAEDFLVVYDPDGGFVTGGGWIWSQAGWCQLDALCAGAEGKANFGFVSRYKKGASVPTGNTQFSFSAGGLDFHASSYDWLVINQGGVNAHYKGSGTVGGSDAPTGDPYRFMIWAKDLDGGADDTFRIRIWYEDGGEIVVYDNGFDQEIGGGNIKIHQAN